MFTTLFVCPNPVLKAAVVDLLGSLMVRECKAVSGNPAFGRDDVVATGLNQPTPK
jgi:hypothetical protein